MRSKKALILNKLSEAGADGVSIRRLCAIAYGRYSKKNEKRLRDYLSRLRGQGHNIVSTDDGRVALPGA